MKYPEVWAAVAAIAPAVADKDPTGLETIRNMPMIFVRGNND
jgi:hypothetical protein